MDKCPGGYETIRKVRETKRKRVEPSSSLLAAGTRHMSGAILVPPFHNPAFPAKSTWSRATLTELENPDQ